MRESDAEFLVKRNRYGSSTWISRMFESDMTALLAQRDVTDFLERTNHLFS